MQRNITHWDEDIFDVHRKGEETDYPITPGAFNRQISLISIVHDAGDICRPDALPRNSRQCSRT
jgi:hypothetical protein